MSPLFSPEDGMLLEALASRAPSDTVPVLLALARAHSARRRPRDLVAQYARDPFVARSPLDLRLIQRLDALALEAAPDFEAVLLSPLAPLGCCSVVAPMSQDRALATARATEVVSDPTNVLALECARRLAHEDTTHVRLCTLHQVTRTQPIPPQSGFTQHFRLFAMAEAGLALEEHGFEVRAMAAHAGVFVRVFDAAERLGCSFPERRAQLLVGPGGRAIADRLGAELGRSLPALDVCEAALDSRYYAGVRLLVGASGAQGGHVNLGDIGLFDWMAKLTSNRRLRFVASGLGLQLLPMLFRRRQGASGPASAS